MGNTKNSAGKRVFDDIYSFPVDLQNLADDIWDAYVTRVGTAQQRGQMPPGQLRTGLTWIETDTGYTWRRTSSAWVLVDAVEGVTVRHRTAALSLGGTEAVIDWNVAQRAPATADFTYNAGVFTATSGGKFRVHAQLSLGQAGATGMGLVLRHNTTDVAGADAVTSTAGGVTVHVFRELTMAPNDTLQLRGFAGATIPVSVSLPRQTFIEIARA